MAASANDPVCVAFFGGGNDIRVGKGSFGAIKKAVQAAGVRDFVVIGHATEPEFEGCNSWQSYVDRACQIIDATPGVAGRPLLLVSFSYGGLSAYGVAQKLGERVKKFYLLGRRSPDVEVVGDVYECASAGAVLERSPEFLARKYIQAWGLGPYGYEPALKQPYEEWHKSIKTLGANVRLHYSSSCAPISPEAIRAEGLDSDPPKMTCPILAVVARIETPQGEGWDKMQGWARFTSGRTDFVVVDTDHCGLINVKGLGSPVGINVIANDMRAVLATHARPKL